MAKRSWPVREQAQSRGVLKRGARGNVHWIATIASQGKYIMGAI